MNFIGRFISFLIYPFSGLFIGLGLSGIIPAMHYVITDGFYNAIHVAALGWLVLMAILYITGAVIYAIRFPERMWPGKFDIMVSIINNFFFSNQGNMLTFKLNYFLIN